VPPNSKLPRYDQRCVLRLLDHSLGVSPWLILSRVSRVTGSLLSHSSCLLLFRSWHTSPASVSRHLLTVNMRSLPIQARFPVGLPPSNPP
jgi:hypothetical protein